MRERMRLQIKSCLFSENNHWTWWHSFGETGSVWSLICNKSLRCKDFLVRCSPSEVNSGFVVNRSPWGMRVPWRMMPQQPRQYTRGGGSGSLVCEDCRSILSRAGHVHSLSLHKSGFWLLWTSMQRETEGKEGPLHSSVLARAGDIFTLPSHHPLWLHKMSVNYGHPLSLWFP